MKIGDTVAWQWSKGVAEGVILELFFHRHEITTKGKRIARNGTKDNPAILIRHSNGTDVLKLASEIQRSLEN